MRTEDGLDRKTLLFIIDKLDYNYHFLKELQHEFNTNQEEFRTYGQRLEGMRQAIKTIEELL